VSIAVTASVAGQIEDRGAVRGSGEAAMIRQTLFSSEPPVAATASAIEPAR
jgi:hypothetical protein